MLIHSEKTYSLAVSKDLVPKQEHGNQAFNLAFAENREALPLEGEASLDCHTFRTIDRFLKKGKDRHSFPNSTGY
jgi:hypothetical protein